MKHSLQLFNSYLCFTAKATEVQVDAENANHESFYTDIIDEDQLHDLIGLLLHIQSKIRKNGNR